MYLSILKVSREIQRSVTALLHANVDSKEKLIFTMLVCSTGRACSSETKTEGDFFFVKNPKHFGSEFVSVNLPFTRSIHGTVA